MQVTKQQLSQGIARYIRGEIIPRVPEKSTKFLLDLVATGLDKAPTLLDPYLQRPVVLAVLQEKDGLYDIDLAEDILTTVLTAQNGYRLSVPGIPMISPEAKDFDFCSGDIAVLRRYIVG